MNWLPPMLVKVSQLVLPGDIKARQKQAHVVELAESIRERTGKRPIHLPTIDYPSKELIAGRDRVAACLLNGNKSVWVQPVSQLTPKERRDLERDENLHRRVADRDALVRQRVEEREAEIEAERMLAQADEPRKPGRPKTAKGEAREQVARELGTTPDAIRVAEARAAAEEEEIPNKYSDTPRQPSVETYGLPLVTNGEEADIVAFQAAVDQADSALRRAQAALGGIERGSMFAAPAQRLAARIHEVASDVRYGRITHVCPYCKRTRAAVGCAACGTCGFVPAEVMLGVADELKLGGAQAMVATPLGLVPYAQAAKSAAKGSAKPAKKITVLDQDDKPIPLPDPAKVDNEIGEDGMPF